MPTALSRAGQVSGDLSEGVTPVPIPNTVVKPFSADDTAWVTVWERRPSPGLNQCGTGLQACGGGGADPKGSALFFAASLSAATAASRPLAELIHKKQKLVTN